MAPRRVSRPSSHRLSRMARGHRPTVPSHGSQTYGYCRDVRPYEQTARHSVRAGTYILLEVEDCEMAGDVPFPGPSSPVLPLGDYCVLPRRDAGLPCVGDPLDDHASDLGSIGWRPTLVDRGAHSVCPVPLLFTGRDIHCVRLQRQERAIMESPRWIVRIYVRRARLWG